MFGMLCSEDYSRFHLGFLMKFARIRMNRETAQLPIKPSFTPHRHNFCAHYGVSDKFSKSINYSFHISHSLQLLLHAQRSFQKFVVSAELPLKVLNLFFLASLYLLKFSMRSLLNTGTKREHFD